MSARCEGSHCARLPKGRGVRREMVDTLPDAIYGDLVTPPKGASVAARTCVAGFVVLLLSAQAGWCCPDMWPYSGSGPSLLDNRGENSFGLGPSLLLSVPAEQPVDQTVQWNGALTLFCDIDQRRSGAWTITLDEFRQAVFAGLG